MHMQHAFNGSAKTNANNSRLNYRQLQYDFNTYVDSYEKKTIRNKFTYQSIGQNRKLAMFPKKVR